MRENEAYQRLMKCGVRPSSQRIAIMDYLLTHYTHPTVEDVYQGLCGQIPKLSRTTVYNTLRLFSDHHVAQMITIDEHHVCYDGNIQPHVHFYCKNCGKVIDLFDEDAPAVAAPKCMPNGCVVDEMQLYYKGVCADCRTEIGN
ncbi:MAG TPA: Fur family transcriptional regulator [Prevotella sp.]